MIFGYSRLSQEDKLRRYDEQQAYEKALRYQKSMFLYETKEKPKMTREDAVKKLELSVNKNSDVIQSRHLVDALEALGLIKFDEPKDNVIFELPACATFKGLNFILNKSGYKVVKI